MERTIFTSPITSERHRKHGYCEKSDFGRIDLIELQAEDKQLIVSFKDYSGAIEFIEYKGFAFKKVGQRSGFGGMSRDEEGVWLKKQGKFSEKTALKLVLDIRERFESRYYPASSERYILIGKTLYVEYCKLKDLTITVAGNLLFSCWLSIDFESHGGKQTFKLNKKNFERVFKEQKARFEKAKPVKGAKVGDGHVNFSFPKQIVWGNKYI
jgi:hypothetical protein